MVTPRTVADSEDKRLESEKAIEVLPGVDENRL